MKPYAIALAALCLLAPGCAREEPAPHVAPTLAAVALPLPRAATAHVGWNAGDLARLRAALQASIRGGYLGGAGIAVAADDGRLLFGRNAAHAYAPASALKTIVAATSLATLGPDARLVTAFEAVGLPDAGGGVDDMWLLGTGDPMLDPEQLRGGVGALVRRGVRRIDGDLFVDAAAFSGPEQNPAWAPEDFEYGYATGTSALSLNWDVIEFKIAPAQIGAPARVRVFPPNGAVIVHGAPVTGYSTNLQITRTAPGRNEFTVTGTIAAGWEQSFFRPAAGVPLWAGAIAAEMLAERGIELGGTVKAGSVPLATQTLWEHRSPPLGLMLRQMLFESDNHIAEQLLRVLGATDGDGSDAAGASVERAFLVREGIPIPGLRLLDGSGLAEGDRVAPVTFVRLLAAVDLTPYLPRAGIEGTVRHHDLSAARGRVRAKSGHIDGVNALAGYVETRAHGRVTFAFLVNAPGADNASSIEAGIDRALDALSEL